MKKRESVDVDILFVGCGVASLSGAIHLADLIARKGNDSRQSGGNAENGEISIAILEKGSYAGAHAISGAVMDLKILAELIPDYGERNVPIEAEVKNEDVFFLTRRTKIRFPFIPPPLENHGNYVVSLSRLTEWMAQVAEEKAIDIYTGIAGTEILYDGPRVIGVRTGDKGIDSTGKRKENFEPGIDLKAKITVFGEGSRGSLAKDLISKFRLDAGCNPESYVIGIKEVWEIPEGRIQPGHVIHTVGYPHKRHTYGGGFIYGMRDNLVSLGLMCGLDYGNPCMNPHHEFQRFKTHPLVAELLEDGKILQYGANTAPVGGYFSIPRPYFDGGLLIGDSANLFISQKIKGIQVAMRSGMLAAESIFNALSKNDFSCGQLKQYHKALFESEAGKDLYRSRNFHQSFKHGLLSGILRGAVQYLLGGRIIKARLTTNPDYINTKTIKAWQSSSSDGKDGEGDMRYDGKLTFDKESDVYYSGTAHEENQPPHLKIKDPTICLDRCFEEYQAPCQNFCPAKVYEILSDSMTGKRKLRINFSNCLHCKTCDIKDPYQNITWTPAEGGDGPRYTIS